jgi:hypothetical protein
MHSSQSDDAVIWWGRLLRTNDQSELRDMLRDLPRRRRQLVQLGHHDRNIRRMIDGLLGVITETRRLEPAKNIQALARAEEASRYAKDSLWAPDGSP